MTKHIMCKDKEFIFLCAIYFGHLFVVVVFFQDLNVLLGYLKNHVHNFVTDFLSAADHVHLLWDDSQEWYGSSLCMYSAYSDGWY